MDYAAFARRCEEAAHWISIGRSVKVAPGDLRAWGVQPLLAEVKNNLGLIAFESNMDAPITGGSHIEFKLRLESTPDGGGRLIAKKTWHD